ncbi:MAG: translation initiation factor IF-2 [Coriobacteriia bacterium]|nr:translation initiation factor IF-2 [Coriobacteriia bacterium]
MAGIKVHELAKEFGMSSKELMTHLEKLGIPAKSHATSLVDAYVDMVRASLATVIESHKAEIEAEKTKAEAEIAQNAVQEEEARKAEELKRRKAEEGERKRREEERKRREEEKAQAEIEARTRAQEENDALIESPKAVVEEAPPIEKKKTPTDALEAAIAAESQRLAEKAKEESAAKVAKKTSKKTSKGGAVHPDSAKKPSGAGMTPEVPSPAQPPISEEDRYAQMARQAEKIQRDKVLAEMKAEVAAAQAQNASKKKKKKKHGETVEENVVQESKNPNEIDLPHGGEAVSVPEGSTVAQVAELLDVATNDIIKRLFLLGNPLTLTQTMSNDLIELISGDLEREVTIATVADEMTWTFEDDPKDLTPRSPVVTVMGHVDHGKTSLLDAIRETGVAASEAGGITQHIGASVVYKNGRTITFIDTPGHEAFTAMRARGAEITDIVILVVAADDGVMPQTVEAISHARAAGVPIIVAVNKVDKEGANPDQVRQMLTEYELVPEEWGGKNIFVNVSAKMRIGIDDLLEMVLLQADMLELKANENAPAFGTVVEAKLDKGRGPVATVLVQRGTLHVGETLVAGTAHGRVRALIDPFGKHVKSVGPSQPAEILGLGSVPSAGDEFLVFEDERSARALADDRAMKQRLREHAATKRHVSLDDLFSQIEAGELQTLNLIVKVDVQGSIEALRDALDKMDQTEVRIDVIHAAVGGITETDVQLAAASDAIIIGFNVRPTPNAKAMAAEEKVDIRMYRVIYKAIEEINAARVGLLAPEFIEEDTGRAEVRDLFKVPKMGVIAGSYVLEGEISREDKIRVVRDSTVIFEGKIGSLRRFKDDVKSVKFGFECGIGVEGYQDLKAGDFIESYKIVEVAREN